MQPCQQEKAMDMIIDDLKEIKSDIKDLIGFKSKIVGIVIACSAIMTLVFNGMNFWFKK